MTEAIFCWMYYGLCVCLCVCAKCCLQCTTLHYIIFHRPAHHHWPTKVVCIWSYCLNVCQTKCSHKLSMEIPGFLIFLGMMQGIFQLCGSFIGKGLTVNIKGNRPSMDQTLLAEIFYLLFKIKNTLTTLYLKVETF